MNIFESSELELRAAAHFEMVKRDAAIKNIEIIHQELDRRQIEKKDGPKLVPMEVQKEAVK